MRVSSSLTAATENRPSKRPGGMVLMRTSALPRVVAPLFSPSALLPMGEPGGVAYPIQHTPGVLRPFGASLAVAMPQAAKHSTDNTSPATKQPTQRSDDGRVYPDTLPDTGSDS